MSETREFADGSTITREESDALGYRWSEVCLYTEPVPETLPLHRTEAGWPNCSTCDGGGCPDCTDPA